jgi:KipI family sensor histidine kinase inhibitor
VTAAPRVLPYGERALLVELDSLADALALYPALAAGRVPGVGELVPAARTVLVTVDPSLLSLGAAERWIRAVAARLDRTAAASGAATAGPSALATIIPVRYTGPDLDEVAAFRGMTRAEVIRDHTQTDWRVAFIGFAPGFAYLTAAARGPALPAPVSVPRRATSRPQVPAGSVGLAGEFTGVYPRASPGGWQLIGVTDAVLWDPARESPALLAPGTRVRFVAVDAPEGGRNG